MFLQKCTKDNLDMITFCHGLKSFQAYEDVKMNNDEGDQNNFLNYELHHFRNDNIILPQCGSFKLVDQTTSPVKTKFERPIILLGKTLTRDE